MNINIENQILDIILPYIASEDISVYLYGSVLNSFESARDIDLLCISETFIETYSKKIESSKSLGKKSINAYFAKPKDLIDDIDDLKFGGYYSDKFAMGFKKINQSSYKINLHEYYWQSKLYQFMNTKIPFNVNDFINYTHSKILEYNPAFVRSMILYKNQNKMREELIYFIEKIILPDFDLKNTFRIYTVESLEACFYRFWREYNKHKCNKKAWGKETFNKISFSCNYGANYITK